MRKEEEIEGMEREEASLETEIKSFEAEKKPEKQGDGFNIEFEKKELKVETEIPGRYNENEFVDDTAELAEWLHDVEREHINFEKELASENKKRVESAKNDPGAEAVVAAWYRQKEEELEKKYEEARKKIDDMLNRIGMAFEEYAEKALEITPEKMELVDEKMKSELEKLEIGTLNIERIGDELYTGDRFKEDWEKIQANNKAIYDVLGELNNYLTKELLKKWEEAGQYTAEMDEWERNNRNYLQARSNDLVRISEEKIIEMIKKSKRYIEAVFALEMGGVEGATERRKLNFKDGDPIELLADTLPIDKYNEQAYHADREMLDRLYREYGVTREYIKAMETIGKKHLIYTRKFLGE